MDLLLLAALLGADPSPPSAEAPPPAPAAAAAEAPVPPVMQPWKVRVEVLDADGLPVPGTTVQLGGATFIGGPRLAVSDESGECTFEEVPAGGYQVVLKHAGFVTQRRIFEVMATPQARVLIVRVELLLAVDEYYLDPWWPAVIDVDRGPVPVVLGADAELGHVPDARDLGVATELAVEGWVVTDRGPEELPVSRRSSSGGEAWMPGATAAAMFPAGPTPSSPLGWRRDAPSVLSPR